MWRTNLTTTINAKPDKVWEVITTPDLWVEVDPKHYKEVYYDGNKLEAGTKGKMKTEDSPTFSFKVVKADPKTHEVVTRSGLPFGALTLTKKLSTKAGKTELFEEVTATGPFANLFAKKFFEKQIKGTLPAQHQAIKKYAEKSI